MVKEWFVDPDYQREIERGAFIGWEQTPDAGPGREVMQEILDKIHTRLRPGGAREAGRKSYQGKRRGGPSASVIFPTLEGYRWGNLCTPGVKSVYS